MYDIIIIGAGPSGIFTALELVKKNVNKKILLIEKGKRIDKRHCPKEKTNECVGCKPYCHITTGFSGAGAFSDGKLSLSYEVGGDLPELIGKDKAEKYIKYADDIYLEFGADTKIEGLGNEESVKEIRRKAIEANLKLVDCPIRHLGTEKAQEIYLKIQNYLIENNVEIKFDTLVKDFIIENDKISGVIVSDSLTKKKDETLKSEVVIAATGRKGADWLNNMCEKHNVNHRAGTVDIGVRVEIRNEIMEKVNNVLYESKLIGYPAPFDDKVRTFCQNPGGFVSQENYDNNLAIVNGHSYKEKKSNNTNLAILSSHNFSAPFNKPIEYGKKVAELVNLLGGGSILVQRYGDIIDGKRTWEKELKQSNVVPTLKDAVAGDLTSAIPYRTMTNIVNFIEAMNTLVPGFASKETLLYGPEIKFYSNKIDIDRNFETNINGLYCLGDSSGWTRGLMMASVMGVLMARVLTDKEY
ncbi:NAD(P)/FAD-dependent oxidoreductase [Clostridium ihumii]|uniref:NAD(P)/FAD-dependent oxidoreductase n=1 Tax=Clostridium ihumii TaxID=1470356 RepID=UPI003D3420EC